MPGHGSDSPLKRWGVGSGEGILCGDVISEFRESGGLIGFCSNLWGSYHRISE